MDSTLLIVSLSDLSLPEHVFKAISYVTSHSRNQFNIILISSLFEQNATSHSQSWSQIQRLLTLAYVEASGVAQTMNNVLLDINILLKPHTEQCHLQVDKVYTIDGDEAAKSLAQEFVDIPQETIPNVSFEETSSALSTPSTSDQTPSMFPVVVIGGTFDHLHAGHKILLSMSAWITEEKLIVGLTDDALLHKKSHRHVLEDIAIRRANVSKFLDIFKPSIQQDIVPINDVYGPTGWDPNIQALVVSRETLGGADAIASRRKEQNLPPLQTFVIDVISPESPALAYEDEDILKQSKMSSTSIRQWIVSNSKLKST